MSLLLRRDHAVFAGTVLAGYLSIFLQPGLPSLPRLVGASVLCTLFVFIGTAGFEWVTHQPRRIWIPIYFVGQLGVGAGLIYLCNLQGQVWIALLPLVSHAVMALSTPWAVIFSSSVALAFGAMFAILGGWQAGLQAGLSYVAAITFVALFTQLAQEAQRAREQVETLAADLQAANTKLREYAAQVEELAITQERNRLAREIHDSLGHYLTVVNVQLEAAQAVMDAQPAKARAALSKAQSLAQEGLSDVRRSVAALRASPTQNRPLREALSALADESRAAGVATELTIRGEARALPSAVDLALYRAVQEALTNTRKHARASQVTLTLEYADQAVRLQVQDNGVGSQDADGGFGLLGLRERIHLLNGVVKIQTAPGQGFRLDVEIPLNPVGNDG